MKKKILVFRYRFLGDTILTVPFLANLRKLHPKAEIVVMTGPQSGKLLENCPCIDRILEFNTTSFHVYDRSGNKGESFWHYLRILREERFDIAYILKRSFSSALLAFLAGIPERIGFDTEWRGWMLTRRVEFNTERHEVENFMAHLPEPYNKVTLSEGHLFWPSKMEKTKAEKVLERLDSKKPKILIHAPAAHPYKTWSVESWAVVQQELHKRGYQVIFSGSEYDRNYYQQIVNLSGLEPDLDLTKLNGQTLRDNITLYSYCDLMISVDSGPMHLAAAVDIPVIGLFGPTNIKRWHPWSLKYELLTSEDHLPCRPCNLKLTCDERRECLINITPAQILKALDRFLS